MSTSFHFHWIAALFVLALAPSLRALSCKQELAQGLAGDHQRWMQIYKNLDPRFAGVAQVNQPRWSLGSKNEVVFVVHGFMGSPAEMKQIGDGLQARGFAVLMGLLPGFGGNAKIANEIKFEDLQRWYELQVKRLAKCFTKVHLVGFSTGALLALDYVNTHPREQKVVSVSLVSPFFSSHSLWGVWIHKLASQVLETISVKDMNLLTRFPDIQVMIKQPQFYLSDVPLRAAGEVLRGGEINLRRRLVQKTKASGLLFLSDHDQVVDQRESEMLVRKSLPSVEFVHFPASERIPHHMMAASVSPKATQVARQIIDFVDAN
jgi:alpha-beta hydrolase superfamily lysophospholipase